jgi:hypothetical protein
MPAGNNDESARAGDLGRCCTACVESTGEVARRVVSGRLPGWRVLVGFLRAGLRFSCKSSRASVWRRPSSTLRLYWSSSLNARSFSAVTSPSSVSRLSVSPLAPPQTREASTLWWRTVCSGEVTDTWIRSRSSHIRARVSSIHAALSCSCNILFPEHSRRLSGAFRVRAAFLVSLSL